MKKYIFLPALLSLSALAFASVALAVILPPPGPGLPTSKDECKKNRWRNFGDTFKNQGDCVSFVVTNGQNPPSGPPIH